MGLPAAPLPDDRDLAGLLEALFRRLRETCPDLTFKLGDVQEAELAQRLLAAVAEPGFPAGIVPGPQDQALQAVKDLLRAEDPEALVAADPRFESPLPARLLIRRARSLADDGLRRGLDVSSLAVLAAKRVDEPLWGRAYVRSIGLEARASRVEALRSTGQLDEAHREAVELLDDLGPCDSPLLRGEIHLLAGRVRQARDDLDAARVLYEKAQDSFQLAGDARRYGRVLLHLADVHRERLEVDLAVDAARRAVGMLGGGADREGYAAALHNLAIYLCDAGSPAEARTALESSRRVRGLAGSRAASLKSLWIEGRIHEMGGDLEMAQDRYREALDGLAAIPLGAEAAAACVDLVGVLVRSRRYREAFDTSSRLGVLFRRHSCPVPALFALLAFREAVQATPPDPSQLLSCVGSLRSILRSTVRP